MMYLCIALLLIFAAVVWFRPKYGGFIIVATLPSYLLRFDITGIPTTVLEMSVYIWVLVTLVQLLWQRNLRAQYRVVVKQFGTMYPPLLVFVLAATIAMFFAPDIRLAAGAWKAWIIDPALFAILCLYYFESKDIGTALRSAGVGALFVSGWGLVELLGGFGMQLPGFLNAMYESANMAALFLVPLWFLILGWLVAQYVQTKSLRATFQNEWLLSLAVVLGGVSIYFTRSYGALLATGVAAIAFVVFLPKDLQKLKRIIAAILIVVGLLGLVGVLTQGKLQRFFDDTSYNSLQTRQQIWAVAWDLISEHPIRGIGFGNFEQQYYDRAFELYSPPLEWEVPKAHNLYLNVWLEMGLLGLVSFVWLIAIYFQQSIHVLKKSSLGQKMLVLGLISAMIAILVHGLVDTPYFKNDLSFAFWLLIILLVLQSQFVSNIDEK